MSAKRITMRKIRDVLRLRFAAGLSIRQIKASTKVSVGTIQSKRPNQTVISFRTPGLISWDHRRTVPSIRAV